MKKVYQEIIDKGKGDCARAAIASLFELELHEIPNFIELHSDKYPQSLHIIEFMENRGYSPSFVNRQFHETIDEFKKILYFDGGINGYFYASVPSQTFSGSSHAVIIDKDMNIVHDPNPNHKALGLNSEYIINVLTVTDFYIDTDGFFVKNCS